MTPALKTALALLKDKGLDVTPRTEQALADALDKYQGDVSQKAIEQLLEKILAGVKSIAYPTQETRVPGATPVEVGASPATLRAGLKDILDEFSSPAGIAQALNLDFKIRTAAEVLQGAGRFLLGQTDVDDYPAWELYRAYDRKVPRLWAGDEGTDDASLGSAFASRWYAAAQASGDTDAARILDDEGRMVALKSSDIWDQLGSMFDDSLGNPYPPFAFNSGMEVDGVPLKECIDLGLMDEGDEPEGSDFDLASLIGINAA